MPLAAAEVGRPDQRGPICIKLRDERFLAVKILSRLIRVLGREIVRDGPSHRVGVTVGVRGNVMDAVVRFPGEISRVGDNGGIDHQRTRTIVIADGKSGAVALRHETAGDGPFASVVVLIDERLALAHLRAAGRGHHQCATGRIHFEPLRAVEIKSDPARIRARCDDEIVL